MLIFQNPKGLFAEEIYVTWQKASFLSHCGHSSPRSLTDPQGLGRCLWMWEDSPSFSWCRWLIRCSHPQDTIFTNIGLVFTKVLMCSYLFTILQLWFVLAHIYTLELNYIGNNLKVSKLVCICTVWTWFIYFLLHFAIEFELHFQGLNSLSHELGSTWKIDVHSFCPGQVVR